MRGRGRPPKGMASVPKDGKVEVPRRQCLRCDKSFRDPSKNNRICRRCKNSSAWRYGS